MVDNVNANIRVDIDTSQALASLQSLQSRISTFNQSVIQSNASAVAAQKSMVNGLQAQIGASRQFSTSITNVESNVSRLQGAIDRNKLSMGQYFRYGVASSKNFGKVFRQENEQITRLATERVKRLQTQYLALGESHSGMTRAMQVRPLQLFNADAAIAVQRAQIFNKLLNDGSTNLLNFGKNTQWAGRQLMVGFTVPLTIFGGMASKIFMDLEEQAIAFRKVYGDIFTSDQEVEQNLEAVRELTKEMTKYGIAAKETFELANIAAQSGARGADLMAQTREATRLAVLGQMEQAEAVRTTITLQNAFQLSNEELADSVNFLNIVENQSVLSLQDVAGAIPRVAPVVKSLGGDVRDLSVMLVAMREGGVSAAEGANALKTSLARLISPTAGATSMASEMGIALNSIVEGNQGDILGAVLELSQAMEALDELSQQRLLSEIFGKRQYARVGALFNNITNEASQAQRVLDLTTMSTEDLAETATRELGAVEQSIATKFTGALEKLKVEIAPIGEQFLKLATPLLEQVTKLFERFNDLSPTVKNFITILVTGLGVVTPVLLMLIGLFANFAGNALKGVSLMRNFMTRLRGGADSLTYLSGAELDAAAAAASLEGQVNGLTGSLNVQREALDSLISAYTRYISSANAAASSLPQGFRSPPARMATGGMVGGTGNSDNQPALLTPGEFVMNKGATERFGPILDAMNRGSIVGLNEGSRLSEYVGKTARTHLTGRVEMGVSEALGLDRLTDRARTTLSVLQEVERTLGRSVSNIAAVSNLIVEMPANFNEALRTDSLTGASFGEQFGGAGLEKWETTVAVAGEDFEELRPGLEKLDRAIVDVASDFATVGDSNIDDILRAAFEKLDPETRQMLQGIEALSNEYNNIRVSVSGLGTLTEEQRRLLAERNILIEQENDRIRISSGVGDASLRTRQETLPVGRTYKKTPLRYSAADVSQEVIASSISAASQAGVQGSQAYWDSFTSSMKAAGATAGETLKLMIKSGLTDATVAAQALGQDTGQAWSKGYAEQLVRGSVKAGELIGPSTIKGSSAASPPPWSLQLGMWIGEGIEQGALNALQDINAQIRSRFGGNPFGGMASGPAIPFSLNPFAGAPKGPTSELSGGLAVAPQSIQDDIAGKVNQTSENFAKNTEKASRQFGKIGGAARKLGGALNNGSLKLQGAFFAFDGLVFAASMMNGTLGDLAQKALPVIFGLQGLTMVLPMLTNKFTLMAAPLIASAAAIWFFKKKADDMTDNVRKMSEALISTSKTINEVGEFYGNQSLVEQQQEDIIEERTGVAKEDIEKAEEFIETETGKNMQKGLAMAMQNIGSSSTAKQFSSNLASMVLQGVMSPTQAKAVAVTLGKEIGNEQYGIQVSGQLEKLLGPGDRNLLENPLQLAIEITSQSQKTLESVTQGVGELEEQFTEFTQVTGGDIASSFVPIFGQINAINKATLGWDNAIGSVARSARGILNTDDFEKVVESLQQIGSLYANEIAQGYDALSAAKTRYKNITDEVAEADEKDAKAKEKLVKQAEEAKTKQEQLEEVLKNQEKQVRETFASMDASTRVPMLEGMRASLEDQFADSPVLKMAYDMLAGELKGVSQNLQFGINLALNTGRLNPIAAEKFFDFFATGEDAARSLDLLIQTNGIDAANQQIIDILNMQDEDLQKQAVVNILVSQKGLGAPGTEGATGLYEGTPLEQQEGADAARQNLKGLKNAADEANASYQNFLDTQGLAATATSENAYRISELKFAMDDVKGTLSRVYNEQKMLLSATEDLSGEALHEAVLESEAYKDVLSSLTPLQKEYNELVKDNVGDSQASQEFEKERARLLEISTKAQQEYNRALAMSKTQGMSPAEEQRYFDQFGIPSEVVEDLNQFLFLQDQLKSKEIEIQYSLTGMDIEQRQIAIRDAQILNSMDPELLRLIKMDTIGDPSEIEDLVEGYRSLGKAQTETKVREAILKVMGGNGENAAEARRQIEELGYSMEEFAKLDNNVKYNIMANIEARINIEADIRNLESALEGPITADRAEGAVSRLGELKRQLKELEELFSDLGGIDVGGGGGADNEPPVSDGGGGGAEESFLEGLINTFKANDQLFNTAEDATNKYLNSRGKFFGMLEKLRKEGIPEGIISMIGTGTNGVANAKELLNATAKERKELLRYYGRVVAGEAADEIRVEAAGQRIAIDAMETLTKGGATQELKKFVQQNEKLQTAFAGIDPKSKEYAELVKLAEELLGLTEEREEAEKSISDRIKDQADDFKDATDAIIDGIRAQEDAIRSRKYDDFEKQYGISPELLQEQIDRREYQITLLGYQVEKHEKIIEAEEDRISAIQEQIDAKERDIEKIERANELDNRKIETLNREVEMRNRISESLERELSTMSDTEQQIRDTYQARIDALDEVTKLNDYLINQQRTQIDLSKAISQGDVYAAAAAAQEMRAAQAGFAQAQIRAGLEAGMEGQIAGLRTSGGLTRAQAEAQIATIKEQNYQTSLKIRTIEDAIFERSKEIIPIKDEIYNLDQDIFSIERSIANEESKIKRLREEQISPMEWANEQQRRLLEQLNAEVDEKTGPLAAKRRQLERQSNIQHGIFRQTANIRDMSDKAKTKAEELAGKWGIVAQNAWSAANAAAQLAGQQLPSIGGSYSGGAVRRATGGYVPGSGGRDSVLTMLTPGEFVVRKSMVNKYGEAMMRDINMGSFAMPKYNMSSLAETPTNIVSSNNVSNVNAPVYNTYDMKFNIDGTNANADEIANKVMTKIRNIDNSSIRRINGY